MNRATRLLVFLLAMACGCHQPAPRPAPEPPPAGIRTTELVYVDTDAFDQLFESALVNQDPVIVVHTGRTKPDWDGRLNAWVAAWNLGGPVGAAPRTARGQIPLPGVGLDEGTVRELRGLAGDLLSRVDTLAREGTSWWAEERIRSRVIGLLKPYDMRFHLDEKGHIDLVFFNGKYASYYPEFVEKLTGAAAAADEPKEWARVLHCSRCKAAREKANPDATLTGRAGAE
jgi:hypothetical protein